MSEEVRSDENSPSVTQAISGVVGVKNLASGYR